MIAGIYYNDTAAGDGFCVSVYVSGCEFQCPGCHNPEAQKFDCGQPLTDELLEEIVNAINRNGIVRPLCLLGGEPLHPYNLMETLRIIRAVKAKFHNLEVYIWTGYTMEELEKRKDENTLQKILNDTTWIIDGRYDEKLRDITLAKRGSSNQHLYINMGDKENGYQYKYVY